MDDENRVGIILVATPTQKEADEISKLQKQCFVDVDGEEANEDFYHKPAIQVLAYTDDSLVGWAGVHIAEQNYKGRQIKLGGYGICTRPDFRHMGIATKVAGEAMKYLKEKGCDIGFLSVNPNDEKSIKLHQKYGFVMLPQHFSWKNNKDRIKEDTGGMVASIESNELFNYVLNGQETLYVGNGYW
ncbi:TPA: hypothetical protein DCP77_02160 [Candidatus Collierbacteria bacterium]|uniref:N-acetyltransferase domain-containing protein n=1 Tax=Candidatus Collierbacteria bacterium GW2011_GWA2_42_17 TaxID=1618378 RepID=A0A0G0Z229_9BACT|nr:MAG: hypothetical protein UU94_C0004G0018 [Candidatus Collierbacteria bacterium GW2011_GWB2_42_12]KKS42835.1 MAG: hypothetical protein UV06_C0005G0029 [Candidatus Collierbacteria bacterium GW2011_GWA2_42_17]KKS61913.1 MAG: hypothetical protein UV29_C0027G0003 [Candidatus Collierbacteria bacterium GW2011_GWD2_42_50]KKS62282.1 MAG: hypothetical protein UV28_C0013G0017 [Candidatus Collierbacteria bacterium GW2011_GWE2_42_48]KKS64094.1 MAG: hypothetical protein UV32_C0026G0033 [Candidatus Collie